MRKDRKLSSKPPKPLINDDNNLLFSIDSYPLCGKWGLQSENLRIRPAASLGKILCPLPKEAHHTDFEKEMMLVQGGALATATSPPANRGHIHLEESEVVDFPYIFAACVQN